MFKLFLLVWKKFSAIFIILINKTLRSMTKQESQKSDIIVSLNKTIARISVVFNKFSAAAKCHILFKL